MKSAPSNQARVEVLVQRGWIEVAMLSRFGQQRVLGKPCGQPVSYLDRP